MRRQTVILMTASAKVTLEQLFEELNNPAAYEAAGSAPGRSHAHDVLDQLNQKLMRVLRDAAHKAEKKPALKEKLDQLEQQWGVPPQQLHRHLHQLGQEHGPQAAADFLRHNTRLLLQLAEVKQLLGTAYMPVIAAHADELRERSQSWGLYAKPEDYLDSFSNFVRSQVNQSVAMATVVNRPRDLTREQLKEVRLLLDGAGYSEATFWQKICTRYTESILRTCCPSATPATPKPSWPKIWFSKMAPVASAFRRGPNAHCCKRSRWLWMRRMFCFRAW